MLNLFLYPFQKIQEMSIFKSCGDGKKNNKT